MHELITLLTTLPVLPFAMGLALCVVYWLIALVSGVDLGSDSADGVVDGAIDGAADGAIDGATDGAIDGAAHGAADGATDGVAEGVAESWSVLAFLASFIPIGRVPITVWVSLFAWWGFLLSLGAALLMRIAGLQGEVLVALGALGAAGLLSLPLSSLTSRPLQPLFRTVGGRGRSSLIGEVAEITTGRVDNRFGQARITLGGDDLLVHVRCDRPGNGLNRGRSALIVAFDDGRDAFIVEPMAGEPRAASTREQTVEGRPRPAMQIDG